MVMERLLVCVDGSKYSEEAVRYAVEIWRKYNSSITLIFVWHPPAASGQGIVIRDIPDGPVNVDDWRVVLPPKEAVYNTIEGMIAHFENVVFGIRVPAGETYYAVEGGNGEVGFFLVSDGSGRPYRVHIRPPCFAIMQALSGMVRGGLVADIVPTFDSINMIGGEIDR